MPTDPTTQTLVLCSGGLRSLVALALVKGEEAGQRVTLLHVDDGRPSRKRAADAAARQAEAFQVDRIAELSMPHVYDRHAAGNATAPGGSLAAAQVVLAAECFAVRHRIGRVVYPASCGLDTDPLGRAIERLLLVEQLAAADVPQGHGDAENRTVPRVETPLLELTDQQIVELGGQLGADFGMSWSCTEDSPHPCQVCSACRRRKTAFDRAGLEDPLFKARPAAA